MDLDEQKGNDFSAKLGPALDIVNLSAKEAMGSLDQYGNKMIVVVDDNGSHWRGILVAYNFMYIVIYRDKERMKILCDNIERILVDVMEDDDAIKPE